MTTELGARGEELLAPLLRGDFVLTDGKGAITRWGEGPAKLFGWRSEEVIGRSAFDALLASGGSKWRRHLEVGEGEPPGPLVEASARHSDGREFPVELIFLPVLLSESLDLSRLLEVVASEGDDETKLTRLKRDHQAAFEAVAAEAAGTREISQGARLAGLVLTYRPLVDTPWTEEPEPAASEPGSPPQAAVGPTEEILRRIGELERDGNDARTRGTEQTSELASLGGELADVREQFAGMDETLGGVREQVAATHQELAGMREHLAATHEELAAMRELLAGAREDACAARAQAEQALALADESHRDAERHRRELADAERGAPSPEPSNGAGEAQRAPRDGFDDADRPMAVIGLDGHFELLNARFEALVGYQEAEFRRARWPSVVDREHLVAHRELLAAFAAGEVETAELDTMYVHGQGLLVPVAGRLELTRDAEGSPASLLLSVEG